MTPLHIFIIVWYSVPVHSGSFVGMKIGLQKVGVWNETCELESRSRDLGANDVEA